MMGQCPESPAKSRFTPKGSAAQVEHTHGAGALVECVHLKQILGTSSSTGAGPQTGSSPVQRGGLLQGVVVNEAGALIQPVGHCLQETKTTALKPLVNLVRRQFQNLLHGPCSTL